VEEEALFLTPFLILGHIKPFLSLNPRLGDVILIYIVKQMQRRT